MEMVYENVKAQMRRKYSSFWTCRHITMLSQDNKVMRLRVRSKHAYSFIPDQEESQELFLNFPN